MNNGEATILNRLKQGVPGQKQTTWWIVLLEGILLLGIGIFTLANPQAVAPWIVVLIAVYLLVDSGSIIRANTINQAHAASQITRAIFSIGLLLSGLVFLVGVVATDDKQGVRGRDIAANTLKILVAIIFLITPPGVTLRFIAIFAAVIGVILIANALVLVGRGVKAQH